jgi:transcriptional repressor NrdR
MRCPFCAHDDTQVKDSRSADDGSAIRRRRECPSCGGRFTTFERVQLRDLMVQKNNGNKELFDREKLIRSLRTPLRKRPVTAEQIERAVNGIVRQLETSVDGEVTSVRIGEFVMQALANLDQVAYVRYASVYRDFSEPSDFRDFLGNMQKEKKDK